MTTRYPLTLLWLFAAAVLLYMPPADATPYWTPEQIAREIEERGPADPSCFTLPAHARDRNSLDQHAYFARYEDLCNFLASMQYSQPGENLGGMIEGESGGDQNVIQTDNTQEAIRVWSQWAIWTDDTASYGENIRLAQGYCERFPAWREEGGGYYAMHNCGWGLEAERKYRQAYSDTSWLWYADSCAMWVTAHPMDYDPNSTGLNQLSPCAQGLGTGGMYPHAVFRGRLDWQNAALLEGQRLKTWFDSNTERLYRNETWALCGGTALWGVCMSWFAAHPDSGIAWLGNYGTLLDIWESTGTWNHSFNTWYANAQFACYEITGDTAYWYNGVYICDSLLNLDTDNDGGIYPGRSYSDLNDHSWVSAYMGWMGMEHIISSSPNSDVAAVGFVSPDSIRPYLAGDMMTVAARIRNVGRTSISGSIAISGINYHVEADFFNLPYGDDSIIPFTMPWIVEDTGDLPETTPLTLTVAAEDDENPDNDTLTTYFDIRSGVAIHGQVFSQANPETPVPSYIEVYHEAFPDSAWSSFQTDGEGSYTSGERPLLSGTNRIIVWPPARYIDTDTSVQITVDTSPMELDFALPETDLLLVDDDVNQTYESFYQTTLEDFPYAVRTWDMTVREIDNLDSVDFVIWFTGNDETTTLTETDQQLLAGYVSGGGRLLLTGQNITDDLPADSWFLNEVLKCSTRTEDTGVLRVSGIEGNPITDGFELFLIGPGGAHNQTSPSSIYILPGGEEIFQYIYGENEPCGVAGIYGGGRYIFLSFGLEAASGIQGSTSRTEVLTTAFQWLGEPVSASPPPPTVIADFWLGQNYPNPFNPATTIAFRAPHGAGSVRVEIFNILGERISTLYDGSGTGEIRSVVWNGCSSGGVPVGSGVYLYRLSSGSAQITHKLQLIR